MVWREVPLSVLDEHPASRRLVVALNQAFVAAGFHHMVWRLQYDTRKIQWSNGRGDNALCLEILVVSNTSIDIMGLRYPAEDCVHCAIPGSTLMTLLLGVCDRLKLSCTLVDTANILHRGPDGELLRVRLASLYLLGTGKTWYETFGFRALDDAYYDEAAAFVHLPLSQVAEPGSERRKRVIAFVLFVAEHFDLFRKYCTADRKALVNEARFLRKHSLSSLGKCMMYCSVLSAKSTPTKASFLRLKDLCWLFQKLCYEYILWNRTPVKGQPFHLQICVEYLRLPVTTTPRERLRFPSQTKLSLRSETPRKSEEKEGREAKEGKEEKEIFDDIFSRKETDDVLALVSNAEPKTEPEPITESITKRVARRPRPINGNPKRKKENTTQLAPGNDTDDTNVSKRSRFHGGGTRRPRRRRSSSIL